MRRGQPKRISTLQREIVALYSRHESQFLPDRKANNLDTAWLNDDFGRVLNKVFFLPNRAVFFIHSQSFYRSRQKLIEKGYLERTYRINKSGQKEFGYHLTDKAVSSFLDGDRTKQLPARPLVEKVKF
jgi:hypothetical protein